MNALHLHIVSGWIRKNPNLFTTAEDEARASRKRRRKLWRSKKLLPFLRGAAIVAFSMFLVWLFAMTRGGETPIIGW